MPDGAEMVRLSDYREPDYRVGEIFLTFDLDPARTKVRAESQIRRRAAHAAPLRLDGRRLALRGISIDGTPLGPDAYSIDEDSLTIHEAPADFTLVVETEIAPEANTQLEGLYLSGGRLCTQCEPEGFRTITYFLDRPDVLARYTVRLEANEDVFPTLLANGNLVESGALPGGRHFAVWRDPHPKPSYLFALVAGAFDVLRGSFQTASGREVALGVYVDDGEAPRAAYALDALKRAMRWDEEVFGREYDLDFFNIVAVRDFNFGAMENKGLNIFNSAYVLADEASATDADFEAIESVVAHEYFHNWTGNRITCRDWFQLCLKEGLTVYRDQEFSADQRSRPVQRIKDVKRLRMRQFAEDAGPLAHPVRPQSFVKIDNFYTATVYEKGAELVRMLRRIIGAEAFAAGMQLYFDRCDGSAATVEDFIGCFETAANRSLSDFMEWYGQAGTPHLAYAADYDAAQQRLTLTITQSTPATPGQSEKRALPAPLELGMICEDGALLASKLQGEPIAQETHHLVAAAARERFVFDGVVKRPVLSLLRGFSAPVIVTTPSTQSERLAQIAHDPDAFTRWEAAQSMARDIILAGAAGQNVSQLTVGFVGALSRELDRAQHDPAFAALALRLPELGELLQADARPDPDRLFAAREALRRAVAQRLAERLQPIAAAKGEAVFSASAAAAGRRALKTCAFDLLAALGETSWELLQEGFDQAGTMTERLAALEALGLSGAAGFEESLQRFYAMWRSNPLVIDKWFSLQAGLPGPMALRRAASLRTHPDFTLRNPNRVRALAMAFATRNLTAFHAADGGGYRFVAGLAVEADALNPALASRLLTGFESWKRFDEGRQAHARASLEKVLEQPGLSENAREMVVRTLG